MLGDDNFNRLTKHWLCRRHQTIFYKQWDTETETKEKIRNKRENLYDKKEAKF